MTYSRPWLSFDEQLQQLKDRGMLVTDDEAALSYLKRIGYYRLSAYWYPFRHFDVLIKENGSLGTTASNNFVANTHFTDTTELYLFDKKLRLLLTDALERIEIALRVDIAYNLGKQDTFGHITEAALNRSFTRKLINGKNITQFAAWINKYRGLVERSKEDFVRHYHTNHGHELPIWVAVEVMDFGGLSQLLSLMKVPDQQAIAERYQLTDWKILRKWVYCLSYLRNLCAHHSRLWNRNITSRPAKANGSNYNPDWYKRLRDDTETLSRPFILIAIVRYFMSVICPNSEWHTRLISLLNEFPNQQSDRKLSIKDMGIPHEWNNLQEWIEQKIKAPA